MLLAKQFKSKLVRVPVKETKVGLFKVKANNLRILGSIKHRKCTSNAQRNMHPEAGSAAGTIWMSVEQIISSLLWQLSK